MGASRTSASRLGRVVLLVLAAAVLGGAGWRYASRWQPAVESYPVQGVDVSAANGTIDWPSVHAAGADFAYVRATEGADRRDPAFAANWAAARDAGMRRGAIHAFSPCQPAVEQANNFIVTVPRVADALPAAVEVVAEPDCAAPPSRGALIDEVARFARLVERHTGEPALLLISPAVERRYGLSAALARPLWATGNFLAPSYLDQPWRMWRASTMRRVDGIEGPVNWDVVAK